MLGWYDAKRDLFASPCVSKHNTQSFNSPYGFCRKIFIMMGEGKKEGEIREKICTFVQLNPGEIRSSRSMLKTTDISIICTADSLAAKAAGDCEVKAGWLSTRNIVS